VGQKKSRPLRLNAYILINDWTDLCDFW